MDALRVPAQVGTSLHGVDLSNAPAGTAQAVVLTFDDGPRRGDTDKVLSALLRASARATFFTLLVRARHDPALVTALLAAGHDVALHGADHTRMTRCDPARLPSLLRDARAELEDLTDAPIRFFRPPYGAQNATVWQATVDAGLVPVVWQRECREWDPAALDGGLGELTSLKAGMVVLAHDTFALPADGAEPVDFPLGDRAALTAAILERISVQGLAPTSLTSALRSGTPVWRVWLDGPVQGKPLASSPAGAAL